MEVEQRMYFVPLVYDGVNKAQRMAAVEHERYEADEKHRKILFISKAAPKFPKPEPFLGQAGQVAEDFKVKRQLLGQQHQEKLRAQQAEEDKSALMDEGDEEAEGEGQ